MGSATAGMRLFISEHVSHSEGDAMTTLGFKTGISPRIAAIVTEILDLMISFPLLYRDEKQGSGHAIPRLTRVMSVGLLIEPRSEQAGYRNGIRV